MRVLSVIFVICCAASVAALPVSAALANPLHDAILSKKKSKIKKAMSRSSYINQPSASGETPLQMAISKGMSDICVLLIEKGADVNATDNTGKTSLHYAASDEALTKIILENGGNVNAKDNDGDTPLHLGATKGAVNALISGGADINAKNLIGKTPLHRSARKHNSDQGLALIEHGADTTSRDNTGRGPIHLLLQSNFLDPILSSLIKDGKTIDAQDDLFGQTPLHYAAIYGNDASAEALIKGGAKIDIRDNMGQTALHLAVLNNHKDIVEMLLANGADINAKTAFEKASYIEASRHHKFHVSRYIDNKARPDIIRNPTLQSKFGGTPLNIASAENYMEIIAVLASKGGKK